jgi:hypothetical protein
VRDRAVRFNGEDAEGGERSEHTHQRLRLNSAVPPQVTQRGLALGCDVIGDTKVGHEA